MFLPRVVEELAKFDVVGNKGSLSKEDLRRQALDCKRIYEEELNSLDHERKKNSKVNKEQRSKTGRTNAMSSGAVEYDSDETIEMTEQEIDIAYKALSSNICHLWFVMIELVTLGIKMSCFGSPRFFFGSFYGVYNKERKSPSVLDWPPFESA